MTADFTTVVAVWGAITGTVGVGIAALREVRENRVRITVIDLHHFERPRAQPGSILKASVGIGVRNDGRRRVGIEHIGLRLLDGRRIEFVGIEPFLLEPDSRLHEFYVPLAELLLVDGVDAFATPVIPWARSSDGRWWPGMPFTLVTALPPGVDFENVQARLRQLQATPRDGEPREYLANELYGVTVYEASADEEEALRLMRDLAGEADVP
jgi:hypothetical protein